jgi:hypothetical protein
MNRKLLGIGDEIVGADLFAHKMLYVGPIGPTGEDVLDPAKGMPARFIDFYSFPNWQSLRLGKRGPASWQEQALVQVRAQEVVRSGVINRTLGPNCEHITSYVRTAKPESPQLRIAGSVAVIGLLLAGLRGFGQ